MPLIKLAVSLVIVVLATSFFSDYAIRPAIELQIYERISQRFSPFAEEMLARFATFTQADDDELIAQLTEEEWDGVAFSLHPGELYAMYADGSDSRFGFDILPKGVALTFLRDDGITVTIEPLPRSAHYFYIPYAFEAILLLIGLLSVLLAWHRRIDRRIDRVLSESPAVLTDNSRKDQRSSFERLLQAHQTLGSQARETTTSVQQRLDNQRDFLHGVAHEFRGPLARLRFAADLDDDSIPKTVEKIAREMDTLVTEILQYSRYHHGQFELEYTSVLPLDLINDALDKMQPLSPDISVGVGPSAETCPAVEVDERLFVRCILNLLLNASRFGKTLIYIDARVASGMFELTVDDDGPGVPPGKTAFIFEPFSRLDRSRSRDSGGTGLGLAIVAGIVKRLGGSVVAGDAPIGGARFRVRIPANAINRAQRPQAGLTTSLTTRATPGS